MALVALTWLTLHHLSLNEITVQGILSALSGPVRVRIYPELAESDCAMNCSAFLPAGKLKLPKSTLSQHFRILREAGLIRSERKGVELKNSTRCQELKKQIRTNGGWDSYSLRKRGQRI